MWAVKLRQLGVAGLVLASILTGASGAAASTTEPYKTARVGAADIALRYPAAWTLYPLTKRGLAALQEHLAKSNPKLALSPDEQSSFLEANKFFAADLDPNSPTYLSNVSVQRRDSVRFPSNSNALIPEITKENQQAGATVLHTASGKIDGQPFVRADVHVQTTRLDGQTVAVRVGELLLPVNGPLVPHGNGLAVVTIGAPDSAVGTRLIDAVLGSVRHQ
jgi:hypothetical protein